MTACLKIPNRLLADIRADLARPHPFAHERVGFLTAGVAKADWAAACSGGNRLASSLGRGLGAGLAVGGGALAKLGSAPSTATGRRRRATGVP